MRRVCLSILLLGGALGVPFRPALRGLGPVYFVPAVRRRGGVAPRAVSSADVSEKGELLDAASRLMGSVEPPDAHTAGSVIDQLIDHPLNEEEYARLISLSGHAGNWQATVSIRFVFPSPFLLPNLQAPLPDLRASPRGFHRQPHDTRCFHLLQ